MPPPRRRRPVQPATRVRIPRTARSRGTAHGEPAGAEPAGGESAGGRRPVAEAAGTDLIRDDPAHDNLTSTAPAGAAQTRDMPAAGETLTRDEPDTAEPAAETLTRDEPDTAEPTAEAPPEDKADTGEPAAEAPTPDKPTAEGPADDKPAADEPAAGKPAAEQAPQDRPAAATATKDKPAADEPAAGRPAAEKAAPGRLRHPLLLPACLGALAVVLGGLAVWFGLEAGSATSGVDTSNTALTDPAATRHVTQQVTSAVDKIFSYNYADTAKTSQAAAALLTGPARQQYNTLFKLVRQDAPKEKLVLTTTVTNSGVEFLDGSRARLLIFADQRDTAGVAHKTTDAGAMFAVNAVNQGGQWKISSIDTFGAAG